MTCIGRHRLIASLLSVVALGMTLASCREKSEEPGSVTASDPRLLDAAKEPQNWLTHGGTYAEQRYSGLDQITQANIGRLKLAWSLELDTDRGQEATPLVVDGILYATTAWSKVVAADAATGKKLWQYDPAVPGKFAVHACCDVVNRGPAYSNGRLFFGTIDGRLIALDTKTGKPVWSVQTTDRSKPYSITGAPRVARGKVFIGNGGADQGVRGYVSAYDEKSGRLLWRFYTVPGKPGVKDGAASDEVMARLAGPTWYGDKYWRFGGGGTVWDSIVYDSELDRLYIGVGNGGPWNRTIRSEGKGDNLFVASIVALDPNTGKYIWHYQETPGDSWDFTSTQQMTLTSLTIDGKPRKVILHAPKNGFFYVVDRTSGKLISAEKYMPVNWADKIDLKSGRPIENPNARYDIKGPFVATSGPWGAHSWHPMAFSPKTGLVYIPAQMIPGLYKSVGHFTFRPGILNMGVETNIKLPDTPAAIASMEKSIIGELVAWDPIRQKKVWSVRHGGAWNGGVLATGGGLVFQGLADGTFKAYTAENGRPLWSFNAGAPVLPGPVSYSVNNVQYVAVMVGNGTAYNLAMPNFGSPRPRPFGRIIAFRLDGTASLPSVPPTTASPFQAAKESWTKDKIAVGEDLFSSTCAACHGAGARSIGVLPDLRRSPAIGDSAVFRQIVWDGMLEDRGMASFKTYLRSEDVESIRAYLNSRATNDARAR